MYCKREGRSSEKEGEANVQGGESGHILNRVENGNSNNGVNDSIINALKIQMKVFNNKLIIFKNLLKLKALINL